MRMSKEERAKRSEILSRSKKIPGFDNYYLSRYGICISMMRKSPRFVLPRKSIWGYLCFSLVVNGRPKGLSLHRALMTTYKYNKNHASLDIDHIDGNKLNNDFKNLRWVTRTEDIANSIKLGLHVVGSKHKMSKLVESEVEYILKNHKIYSYHKTNAKELADKFNVSIRTINGIVSGKSWKAVSRAFLESIGEEK